MCLAPRDWKNQTLTPDPDAVDFMPFYGPEKPLFDKTWKLPDIQQLR